MAKMKVVQLLGKEKVRNTEVDIPVISDDEVLVKVKAASICGTDVRMYNNGYANVDEEHPLVLGHEIAGEIVEVGSNVNFYKSGMRVALAPNMGCGICDHCISGDTHLCENYEAFGINMPGGFAQYVRVPAKAVRQGNITLIDDAMSYEEASLIEPLSCVYNGQLIAGVNPGDTVLIIGSGPIGIMHAMLAYAKGACKVIMNDLQEGRLKDAKAILPKLITYTSEDLKDKVMKETDGKGVDLCVVAAPSPQAQEESFQYMAMNGRLLFFGGLPKGREKVHLDANVLHYKQLRVFGCTRASLKSYRTSAKMVACGQLPLGKIVSNRYTIEEFEEALKNARNAVSLKNVIVFK